ncbi:hypothetical protein Pelo_16927 [Pelomyxa schiedti]|nr:hypothetical protein Pelo_16927 [Pelomyxa schiedti]
MNALTDGRVLFMCSSCHDHPPIADTETKFLQKIRSASSVEQGAEILEQLLNPGTVRWLLLKLCGSDSLPSVEELCTKRSIYTDALGKPSVLRAWATHNTQMNFMVRVFGFNGSQYEAAQFLNLRFESSLQQKPFRADMFAGSSLSDTQPTLGSSVTLAHIPAEFHKVSTAASPTECSANKSMKTTGELLQIQISAADNASINPTILPLYQQFRDEFSGAFSQATKVYKFLQQEALRPAPRPPSLPRTTSLEVRQALEEEQENRRRLTTKLTECAEICQSTITSLETSGNLLFSALEQKVVCRKDAVLPSISALETIIRRLCTLYSMRATISVCGPTSTGKTTLMESIVGCRCLPIDVDPNTAIPICIRHDVAVLKPVMSIPATLYRSLQEAWMCIGQSIDSLHEVGLPTDAPVLSREACDAYKRLYVPLTRGKLDSWVCQEIVGEEEVRITLERLNGLVRLVYSLKDSPRFGFRLRSVSPLTCLLAGRGAVVDELPLIRFCCRGVKIPFPGSLLFVDTPGVSERGVGEFMINTCKLASRIFQESNGVLCLTEPSRVFDSSSTELVKLVMKTNPRPLNPMVIINKFESSVLGSAASPVEKLAQYREYYRKEYGLSKLQVHWLRAKVVHSITWGEPILQKLLEKGSEPQQWQDECSNTEFEVVKSLLETAFNDWVAFLSDLPEGYKREVLIERGLKPVRQSSNLDSILTASVLPTALKLLPTQCLESVQVWSKALGSLDSTVCTLIALCQHQSNREAFIHHLQAISTMIEESFQSCLLLEELKPSIVSAFQGNLSSLIEEERRHLKTVFEAWEANCPHGAVYHDRIERYMIGDTVSADFNVKSNIVFDNQQEADEAQQLLSKKIADFFIAAPVENRLEAIKQSIFRRKLNTIAGTLKDQLCTIPIEVDEKECVAKLHGITTKFEDQVRRVLEQCVLPQIKSTPLTIVGGVEEGKVSFWNRVFLDQPEYYYVCSKAMLELACDQLSLRCKSSDFIAEQIEKAHASLVLCLNNLQEQIKGIVKLIATLCADTLEKIPEERLETLLAFNESLSAQKKTDCSLRGRLESFLSMSLFETDATSTTPTTRGGC